MNVWKAWDIVKPRLKIEHELNYIWGFFVDVANWCIHVVIGFRKLLPGKKDESVVLLKYGTHRNGKDRLLSSKTRLNMTEIREDVTLWTSMAHLARVKIKERNRDFQFKQIDREHKLKIWNQLIAEHCNSQ